mmetsp:Transcript_87382/g.137950  ORF Transcript_87382/g.137950 Transcript_87382/m.137950 type:complete len:92 (-) Transcript_87382:39-314(-)
MGVACIRGLTVGPSAVNIPTIRSKGSGSSRGRMDDDSKDIGKQANSMATVSHTAVLAKFSNRDIGTWAKRQKMMTSIQANYCINSVDELAY